MGYLSAQLDAVEGTMPFRVVGQVQAISGMTIEASDLTLPLGSLCRIESFGSRTSTAEVIGFRQDRTLLMPLSTTAGVSRGDRIENLASAPRIWCSPQLLGRVLDGFGNPIDGGQPVPMGESRPHLLGRAPAGSGNPTDGGHPAQMGESRRLDAPPPTAMERDNIRLPISTSIRSIDGLHTCGLGQRMGIFAGPGVGKSVLISS